MNFIYPKINHFPDTTPSVPTPTRLNSSCSLSKHANENDKLFGVIALLLNLKTVKIFQTIKDAYSKERRAIDSEAMTLAQQKQEEIKEKFKSWIFEDPERREHLVNIYNERH